MGGAQRIEGNILDRALFIRRNDLKEGLVNHPNGGRLPDRGRSPLGGIDWHAIFSGKHTQSTDVIRVLVGDTDRVDIPHGKSQFSQAFFRPLSADPHVHQQMGSITANIDTVSAAATGNTA